MISKENLDERMCDVVEGAENNQTYREFIRESEKEFNIFAAPMDNMTDKELKDYLDFLDYLWDK